jgi:integrase
MTPATRRASGHVTERRLKDGAIGLYGALRIPDPAKPSGYRSEVRSVGRLWTKGGRPPSGFATRRQAAAIVRDRVTDAGRRALETPEREPAPTVTQVADEWLRAKEHEAAVQWQTILDYAALLKRHLLPEFGDVRVDELTSERIDAWKRRQLADGKASRRAMQRQLTVLHGVMRHAERAHGLSRNPASAALVARPKVRYDATDFRTVTPAQLRSIAAQMPNDAARAAVLVAGLSGCRLGELLALRWRDVDWTGRKLHVRRSFGRSGEKSPKSGKGRVVPLGDELGAVLEALSRRDHSTMPDDLVLVDAKSDRLNGWSLRRWFYGATEAVGLREVRGRHLRFHDLRHSYASLLVRAMPVSDVQAILGHAHLSTTERYIHHSPSSWHVERVNAALAAADDEVIAGVDSTVDANSRLPVPSSATESN